MSHLEVGSERHITLGFVLLSHTQNSPLERLLTKLNQLYGSPPIVIHHDYSQASFPFPESRLTSNVSLVHPHLDTRWGDFSIVDAFLVGLQELYQKHSPDWFMNLSTTCYPVALGTSVLMELASSKYDALLGAVQLYPEMEYPSAISIRSSGEILISPSLPTHTSDVVNWMNACHRRYVASEHNKGLFRPTFGCYAGDQWFTANAKAAAALIGAKHAFPELVRHYSKVHVPDESFCHTVLCNEQRLRVCKCNKRFANWYTAGAHPLELTYDDFGKIRDSRAHFARKISLEGSSDLLNALDHWHETEDIRKQQEESSRSWRAC